MATQITTLTAGYILIQAGRGIPNHLAPKGSQFTDVDTATLYFNKNGLSDWEINIDVGNTGSTVGINTFSSFSSSTIGQGSVIATTSSDNLTFSGVNLSILVDNTNQILTLSAATPSDYTFTGGTVNGLTNFTNGLSATTISACTSIQTNKIVSCSGDTQINLTSGQTIFNTTLIPNLDGIIDVGIASKRFRDINTVSGTSTVWISSIKVNTPTLDLGNDSQGNLRQITADNSIIKDDTLLGGTY